MSMKKLFGAMFLTLMVVMPLVSAQIATNDVYHRKYCVDNTTLRWIKNVTIVVPEESVFHTLQVTEDQICNWGCQNDECMSSPWIAYGIGFVILLVVFIIYLMVRPRG